jgi:hypothetical protein
MFSFANFQDSCYHVRMNFLSKLVSLLTPRRLPPRFNVIPFLTVHDPEADVKSTVRLVLQPFLCLLFKEPFCRLWRTSRLLVEICPQVNLCSLSQRRFHYAAKYSHQSGTSRNDIHPTTSFFGSSPRFFAVTRRPPGCRQVSQNM